MNKNLLPWDDNKKAQDPSGIRIGTQEVTRLGMKENEMDTIADLISKALEDTEKTRSYVRELRKEFLGVQYCFEPGANPQSYRLTFEK